MKSEFLEKLNTILDLPGKVAAAVGVIVPTFIWLSELDRKIEIRISVLILLAGLLVLSTHLLPQFSRSTRARTLSKQCFSIWESIKATIREFHDPGTDEKRKSHLRKRYKLYRKRLMQIVAFNQERILKSLELERPGATNYAVLVKHNFEACFFAEDLDTWSEHSRRNTTNELDSFDSLASKISTF